MSLREFAHALSIVSMIFCLVACRSAAKPAISIGVEYPDSVLFVPDRGVVPDESTAIRIAEAVWLSIYGKSIYDSKPFVAHLTNDSLWEVYGTLPKGMIGGVPYIKILKSDGRIIGVIHGQ